MPTRLPGSPIAAEQAAAPSPWSSLWPWLLAGLPLAALAWWLLGSDWTRQPPLVVGILHSRSGPSAPSERAVVDAETRTVEEIDRAGGLLGRRVRWVVADGASDPAAFAKRAERLIREEKADVIIGCSSASTRRAVVPVVEAADHLLVFPARHEGIEESQAVVSLGPLPNQSVGPALAWCHDALSARRFVIVGTDDTWSRCAAAFAADQLSAIGATLVAEEYVAAGTSDVAAAVREVVAGQPDVVCCLLPGDAAAALLHRLREAGIRSADLPVLLLAVDEEDLRAMPREDATGTYVAASHFQGIDRTDTRDFGSRSGTDQALSERVLSASEAVRLWAGAVRAAGSAAPAAVRAAIRRQSQATAEGVIAIDPVTQHAWRNLTVGRVRPDGLVEPVWTSDGPTRPVPFPITRSRVEWTRFLAAAERARSGRRAVAAEQAENTDGSGGRPQP